MLIRGLLSQKDRKLCDKDIATAAEKSLEENPLMGKLPMMLKCVKSHLFLGMKN